MKDKVICIVGPTASGKTGLGIELAKKLDGEIISADSMQIYKGLDVGTAKVSKEEMQGIKHHMIDICNITDNFSVADFKEMCYDKIDDIIKRGKQPIIVGGTGLYVSAVVYNMQFSEEEIDKEYRNKLYEMEQEKGPEFLYDMLVKLDKEAAKDIHPNNVKRVIRALEINRFSNKLKSTHMEEEKLRIVNEDPKYKFVLIYIDHDRQKLYERINKRVDIMIRGGLVEESKMVYDMNLPKDSTCVQAIGYKEFFPYFEDKVKLEQSIEDLKKGTRKYAKRQQTWFKNKLDCQILDGCLSLEEMISQSIEIIHQY